MRTSARKSGSSRPASSRIAASSRAASCCRLARERPPLGEQDAAARVAGQLLAALDHRRVGGGRAEQRVRRLPTGAAGRAPRAGRGRDPCGRSRRCRARAASRARRARRPRSRGRRSRGARSRAGARSARPRSRRRRDNARAPLPSRCCPASSSATAATITSPRRPRPTACRPASMIAARLPFMSSAPRPYRRSLSTRGEKGASIPAVPDRVQVRVQEQRPAAAGAARDAPTTLGRPGTGSSTSTSRPACSSQAGDEAGDLAPRPRRPRRATG